MMTSHGVRRLTATLVTALALQASAPAARADEPDADRAMLGAYIATPAHRAAVLAQAARDPSWFERGCADPTFEVQPGFTLWAALRFDATGGPTQGDWSERVRARGCGVTRILNIGTLARSEGEPTLHNQPPGETRASPPLSERAATAAYAVATAWNPPGCKDDYVDDTVGIGRHAHDDAPAWSERWTLHVCGHAVAVIVDYRLLYAGDDVRARRITPRYSNELAHPPPTP